MSPAAHVKTTITDHGAILLDTKSGKFFNLNGTAAEIWKALAQSTSPEAVTKHLRTKFPHVPAESIARDTEILLHRLKSLGLLTG